MGKADDDLRASDGLQAYVRQKFFKTLHFSIAWLQRRLSYTVRYEDFWHKPVETVQALTNEISPLPHERIAAGVEESHLEQMRKRVHADAPFFRGGGVGNCKTDLSPSIVCLLTALPPYPSQIQWLGYDLDDYKQLVAGPASALTTYPWLNSVSDRDPSRG